MSRPLIFDARGDLFYRAPNPMYLDAQGFKDDNIPYLPAMQIFVEFKSFTSMPHDRVLVTHMTTT